MKNKLTNLYRDDNTNVTEQADGSLSIVQQKNDARDTQQVVVLTAKEWKQILAIRNYYVEQGLIETK